MRVRTDIKRKEIIEAAAAVFEERGYQGASMSAISARVGGSKATIYGYFKSKEALFAATIVEALEPEASQVYEALENDHEDIAVVLTEFGRRYLRFTSNPEILVLFRTGTTGGVYQTLGPMLYELGPQRIQRRIENYLKRQVEKGRIAIEFPGIAASHLKALIECGITEPLLFGVLPKMSQEMAIGAAVETFLAAYGRKERSKPAMLERETAR